MINKMSALLIILKVTIQHFALYDSILLLDIQISKVSLELGVENRKKAFG